MWVVLRLRVTPHQFIAVGEAFNAEDIDDAPQIRNVQSML